MQRHCIAPAGYENLRDPNYQTFKWVYASDDCSGTDIVQDTCNADFVVFEDANVDNRFSIDRFQAGLPDKSSLQKYACKSMKISFSIPNCQPGYAGNPCAQCPANTYSLGQSALFYKKM